MPFTAIGKAVWGVALGGGRDFRDHQLIVMRLGELILAVSVGVLGMNSGAPALTGGVTSHSGLPKAEDSQNMGPSGSLRKLKSLITYSDDEGRKMNEKSMGKNSRTMRDMLLWEPSKEKTDPRLFNAAGGENKKTDS